MDGAVLLAGLCYSSAGMAVEYDEIGIWSEVKLAIIKEYASAYTTILDAQRRDKIRSLKWLYIDAYAGPGYHLSKTSGNRVEGSPLIALATARTFSPTARTATRSCYATSSRAPSSAITAALFACSTPTTSI
jgi:hypothetical protein